MNINKWIRQKHARERAEPADTESGIDLSAPGWLDVWTVDSKFEGSSDYQTITLRKGTYSSDGEFRWQVNKETFNSFEIGDKVEIQLRAAGPNE